MEVCPLTNQPCDKQRTLHITDVENNKAVATLDLCGKCGAEFLVLGVSIHHFFQQALKKNAKALVGQLFDNLLQPKPVEQPHCPKCGWTVEDINLYKRLGCGVCYSYFDTTELLLNIHGADVHVGKKPKPKTTTQIQISTITAIGVANHILAAKEVLDQLPTPLKGRGLGC